MFDRVAPTWEGQHPWFAEEFAAMGIGAMVRSARESSGTAQFWLAEQLCCAQSAVSRIEKGHRMPQLRTLAKIAFETRSNLTIALTGVTPATHHEVVFNGRYFAERQRDLWAARNFERTAEGLRKRYNNARPDP